MTTTTAATSPQRTRGFGSRLFSALALVGLFSMLLAPAVRADDLVNDVANDTNSATIPLGSAVTVNYWLIATNGAPGSPDADGCNARLDKPTTVAIGIPAGVTASPTSLTFTGCGISQAVTFSALQAGQFVIPDANVSGGVSSSKYNATTTDFVLNVTPPANTAPTVAVTDVANGSAYEIGGVPAALCSVVDAEDGKTSFAATLSGVSGPLAAFGLGSQTAACSYTDGGGLSAASSATYSIVDTIDPVITFAGKSPAANDAGWNNVAVVTLSWSCTDSGSGVSSPVSQQSSTEGTISLTGTCTDNAGNDASDTQSVSIDSQLPVITAAAARAADSNGWYNAAVSVSFMCSDPAPSSGLAGSCPAVVTVATDTSASGQNISDSVSDVAGNTGQSNIVNVKLDKTAPTLSAAADRAANANGWYNDDVTVGFTCADGLSGSTGNPASQSFGEGANQSASATCFDLAGNQSTSAGVSGINIDKTAPTSPSFSGSISGGATYYAGYNVPAAPACSASDALSGLDGGCVVTGYSATVGMHRLTATATDKAGNVATSTLTYTVAPLTITGFYSPVDMNGTVNTVKAGATAPLKFEIFAGDTELTSTGLVKSFTTTKSSCSGGGEDALEITSTGGTSLRYDATGGQYIQNWQTPKSGAGSCYTVTLTTVDGSTISANFKLK